MSHDEKEADDVPRRFRRLRFNPLRDVLPWVAVVVGLVVTLRGAFGVTRHDGPQQLLIGTGLVLIGVIVFLVNRWQARRGH
ncbi:MULTISPECIES: hypothetical protein [unclassified Curtobacterium]|uniref:hypothetical protein n=1 Tax=unclassified Curtobacterium TaxID=257496 RepID=UPI0038157312